MSDLLTEEELQDLTGVKTPGKQASVLEAHGIYYIRRRDGKLRTTWYHVNHPQAPFVTEEPNLESIG